MNSVLSSPSSRRLVIPLAIVVIVSGLAPQQASAATIAYDSFGSTPGGVGSTYNSSGTNPPLYGQSATANLSGFSGNWSNLNTTATSDIRISSNATDLTHTLLNGTAVPGAIHYGNGNSQRSTSRAFSAGATGLINATSTLWFSGLVSLGNLTAPLGSNKTVFGLGPDLNQSSFPSNGVYFGVGNGSLTLNYRNASNAFITANIVSTGNLTINTTYLFAIGIDFSAGNETLTWNVYNPGVTDALSPTYNGSFTDGNLTQSDLSHLVFTKQNLTAFTSINDTPRIDEFRLGSSLADVAVPEPATGLLSLGAFGWFVLRRRRTR